MQAKEINSVDRSNFKINLLYQPITEIKSIDFYESIDLNNETFKYMTETIAVELLCNPQVQNSKFPEFAELYFSTRKPVNLPIPHSIFSNFIMPYLVSNQVPPKQLIGDVTLYGSIIHAAHYLKLNDFISKFKKISVFISYPNLFFNISLKVDDTVEKLKKKIHAEQKYSINQIDLFYKNKQLMDKQTLEELNIRDKDNIELTLRT